MMLNIQPTFRNSVKMKESMMLLFLPYSSKTQSSIDFIKDLQNLEEYT